MAASTITIPAPSATPAPGRTARSLAFGAIGGPLLFTLAWIGFGLLRPPVQTPFGVVGGLTGTISNPISGLGVGPDATAFNTLFVVCGLWQLVGTVSAMRAIPSGGRAGLRTLSTALLAISPLCLALAGMFTLASALYVHIVVGMLLFVSPVVSFLVTGFFLRAAPGWQRFGTSLLLGSPLTLVLFLVYSASFDHATAAAGLGVAGLTERVLLLEIQLWYVLLGWLARPKRTNLV
ncbi:MAG: DUF998 domain-containing protein [Chloroflexi bacterium]|nr:DUF998 domain-containing protein [Chloroflexota bacterium]